MSENSNPKPGEEIQITLAMYEFLKLGPSDEEFKFLAKTLKEFRQKSSTERRGLLAKLFNFKL